MDKFVGRLVYTGDILKRGGDRFDVVIADENVFVVCRRRKYNGRETGETSYRMPEIYSNDPRMGSLDRYLFAIDGSWLDAETPLGKSTARQRAADEKAARGARQEPAAPEVVTFADEVGEERSEEQ